MAKKGKKYRAALELLEEGKVYDADKAVELVKKTATAKFDETIEMHVRLGVDPKYADQQVRGAVVLPNGTGKTKRVLVFAKGEKVQEAETAGADFVGSDELVAKIQGGWLDFDVAIATPDMMALSVVWVNFWDLADSCLTQNSELLQWTWRKLLLNKKPVKLNTAQTKPVMFIARLVKHLLTQINSKKIIKL